ncbi:Rad21/Rec8 N terminal domain protein [Aspergillus nomiae NRRL 13137]|uniref:Rad21/Rec8 N terminal domain protein n=1 Tax=Aspergillus nomiae NRRL (strain ATCC 15546 / NRRL 13137 / CBS 260.88 / M93) TaxID=1509407 RepID=A0A0L1J985_ASPN3|nr:Rad21/Rec8 N terminal domain protein [Aspergillus nomiae NRRL 13137]KNG88292.1 Rad21/Rec8 N terminal domain protein [Aspergillus nomiae NRRL 13137]
MFYSHEMLTSPDHGVATIWLIATLGSKSISKKLNRKTILDVDVPRACHVIMDPEAPMALRLQGNLLYGVSRVYSQQCGYALTDVQAMHDKMRTLLKVLPGGGLDPTAGKTRPDQLVLPYDPSFLPECDLPGMGMDLSKLSLPFDPATSQHSGLLWPKTPDLSQSDLSRSPSLRFSFSYDDMIGRNAGGSDSDTNVPSSAQRSINLGGLTATTFAEEGGIFFSLTSNLTRMEISLSLGRRIAKLQKQMPIDEEIDTTAKHQDERPIQASRATKRRRSDSESTDELKVISDEVAVTMPQKRRAPRLQTLDDRTALRNTDLGNLNSDYVQNMAIALKQKRQNKLPTQAKKNAASGFWSRNWFREELYGALDPTARHKGRKRSHHHDDSEAGSDVQSVRAREEYEEQVGRGEVVDNHGIWKEVEIGRHAPSVFRDDNSFSSQMPWNITASIQSSQHGSSATSGLRGVANVSDPSASRGRDPTASHLAGRGQSRNRLTSASPLAGRGIPFDAEAFDSLTLPGNDDMDVLNDFDLSHYLQTELFGDDHGYTGDDANANTYSRQPTLQDRLSQSSLDQESLNFLGFLTRKLEIMPGEHAEELDEEGFINSLSAFHGSKAICFSALLPPAETSPSVATQGLMHILTLATKGFLSVHQEDYKDRSTRYRIRYEFGEIFLQLSDI